MTDNTKRLTCTLAFSALILLLGLLGSSVNHSLQFQPQAIAQGEIWRVLSGHMVHLGINHTLLNLAGLWLIMLWVGDSFSVRHWLLVFVLLCLGTSACLYFLPPVIGYYAGLSGVLHGLLVYGLWPSVLKKIPLALIALVVIISKLAYEQWVPGSQAATESFIAAPVVAIAHVYGAISGLLLAIGWGVLRFKSAA
ncbi:MAG TPA: rhombosortase [Cellvibrionaceae bacterium]